TKDRRDIEKALKEFDSSEKTLLALEDTRSYWKKLSSQIATQTADKDFDNWLRWVNIQPILRKIFGCSFLPDFDYGKGGRGWRDLWQDCLCLILNNPEEVRPMLLNNFKGVRIDGSNATIIGAKAGEFVADRNNISRVWMDHGVWPTVTLDLYIQQTGDINILNEKESYFGCAQKGTILEHLILQNLVQFFNVGAHNNILLQGADWNDGLDMAKEAGESVAFSCVYAKNLETICELIKRIETDKIELLKEAALLLDSSGEIDYSDPKTKQKQLKKYLAAIKPAVSGEKIYLNKDALLSDLKPKAAWLKQHIKTQEWLKEGFFNGYYDNKSQRVEGNINGLMRMTLTGQVFPVMGGIADKDQVKALFNNAKKYLQDKKLGGFRLNTDFGQEQHDLGRAFSFVYGEKENGAFFNHMSVMFAYALFKQNFISEGFEVFSSIYKMALNTKTSRIFPCLPEYFNAQGQGMYSYLTGSASWFMLTLLTQVFGIRGEYGNLLIEPKLTKEWFNPSNEANITSNFAGKRIEIKFFNPKRKDYGRLAISKAAINGKIIAEKINKPSILIPRKTLLSLCNRELNNIEIILV
ncbi:MAG: cellobiose phosphorylase, partial [Candidatus Omnitrophica bacterium]|nr:cellobiose phosphorylase [Candidatus Omnitrophota bacterium]